MQEPIHVAIGSPVDEIDTPALLVDIDRLAANLRALQSPVRAAAWVHCTPAIAHLQLRERHVAGIAVRGVAEAEVFAAAGCRDVRILRPLVTASTRRRADALARSARVVLEDDGLALWEEDALAGAVTVSATVASTPEPDRAIHDCGQKAIGRDTASPKVKGRKGRDKTRDETRDETREELIANAGSAEHGIVAVRSGAQPFAIGDWLELVPGDVATAFALHDFAYGVRDGRLEAVWPVSARGAWQ